MKRFVALLLALMMVVGLAACGGNGGGTATAPTNPGGGSSDGVGLRGNPDDVYFMCVMVSGVEYWVPVYEMFRQAGQQLGVQTRFMGTPEYDVASQLAVFEQILTMNPAGIFLHPVNADAFVEPINRAIDMGIPVVTFAADSPNSNRRAHITSDNVAEGEFAADTFGELFGGVGQVAVLENPSQDNHAIRIESFIARIESHWPGIELVGRAVTNQDTAVAYQHTMAFIQANPNLSGIFMPEASSALGAGQAVVESGLDIKVLCVDISDQVLEFILDGTIWGALNPDQGMQGYFGMLMLFLTRHAYLVDPMTDWQATGINPIGLMVDNGLNLVTAENAEHFFLSDYLERRGSTGVAGY
ncbi:MAG: substrate-binding domain-containing protein [Oscillospiraceae bacterium]|nr:substrate-binding domain-containing protein [Oscillospiraceae bacterium]